MEEFWKKIISPAVISSVLLIVAAAVLLFVFQKLLHRYLNREEIKERLYGKKETHIKLLGNIIKTAVVVLVAIAVLQINGINVSSLIAGLGIASAIAGLALQDMLKDLIMGSNIISDEFFVIGDVVRYKTIEGKVISFTLKTTKLEDIATGDIVTICNRNISEMTRVSDRFVLELPLPYEEAPEKIDAVLTEACIPIGKIEHVTDCRYLGAGQLGDSAVVYKILITCPPERKYVAKREALQTAWSALRQAQITIPYPQMDVHFSAGTDEMK
ncbi:MAG: mechanosensitive ion channel family protein [Clostridiales bacterium]|nr:mechanosensitive ion channel family protein [Clostridiales bacterium]